MIAPLNLGGQGEVLWQNTLVAGSSIGGQANSVTFGDFDSGNRVTVVGTDATQTHMVAAQFNSDTGVLKTDFGDSNGAGQTGKVILPNVNLGYAGTFATAAVGTGASNFVAARFNTDGTLDNTFGTNGVIGNTDFGAANNATNTIDYARSVAILADGTILVGGYDYTTGTNGQIALADLLDKNKVSVF